MVKRSSKSSASVHPLNGGSSAVAAGGDSPRVLIVDDQVAIRDLLIDLVNQEGYVPVTARNLSEACTAIRAQAFDAVVVDIFLGDDEVGLDLLPLLKQIQPFTPAIVVSGLADVESVISALKEGAYDLLRKPFNIADVRKAIRNAIEKKALAMENAALVEALRSERDSLEARVQEATHDLAAKVETLRSLNEQLSSIFEMSHATSIEGTPSDVLEHILGILGKILSFESAFCVVLDLRAREISQKFASDREAEQWADVMKTVLAEHGEHLESIAGPVSGEERYARLREALLEAYPGGWDSTQGMIMPIFVPGTLLGVFGLLSLDRPTNLSQTEERMVSFAITNFVAALEERNFLNRTRQLVSFGELVTEIAHDLRHPMTSLRGACRILNEKWSEEEKRVRCLTQITTDLSRMESMVSELVNFYNPKDMYMVSVDLHELLNKALRVSEHVLERKHIEVQRDFAARSTSVLGLSPNLIEAFVNFITNATHAMDDGGLLSVRTNEDLSDDDLSRLREAGRDSDQYLRIEIEDNGSGIEPENIEKIFERFYTTKAEGHGLGLSAVRRIIKKNLGAIHVESEPGRGTRFTIYLPKS